MDDMSGEFFGHDLSEFADHGLSGVGGHDGDLGSLGDHDTDVSGVGDHDSDIGGAGGLGSAMSETLPHEPADPTDPSPTDHAGDHTSHDAAGHQPATHAEPVPHHTPVEHTPPHHTAPEHHDAPAPHYPRPGEHLEMDIYGEHYDTGRVEVDMNGDGHADTSVLHTVRDGVAQVEYYTDNNGDGHADELTITDDQGHLISHTQLDEHTGQWEETHIDHPLPTELPDR